MVAGWAVLRPDRDSGRRDQRDLLRAIGGRGIDGDGDGGTAGGGGEARGVLRAVQHRGSHFFYTPTAGGKVDKSRPTQVGRAMQELGIQTIAAYSPQARGRSERNFGTWQNRLPQELRVAGIQTLEEANRFLRERYIAEFNEKFSVVAEGEGTAFRRCSRKDLALVYVDVRRHQPRPASRMNLADSSGGVGLM